MGTWSVTHWCTLIIPHMLLPLVGSPVNLASALPPSGCTGECVGVTGGLSGRKGRQKIAPGTLMACVSPTAHPVIDEDGTQPGRRKSIALINTLFFWNKTEQVILLIKQSFAAIPLLLRIYSFFFISSFTHSCIHSTSHC